MSELRRLIVRARGKFRYPVFACARTNLSSPTVVPALSLTFSLSKLAGSGLRGSGNTMPHVPLRSLCLSLASRPTSISRWQRRKLSVLARQVERATRSRPEAVPVQQETHIQFPRMDPYSLVTSELARIRQNMQKLLAMAHPGLAEAAVTQYYLADPSNQLRSLLVLLFAQATNGLGRRWEQKDCGATYEETSGQSEELNRPLTLAGILNEWNLSMRDDPASFESPFSMQHSISKPAHPKPPPTQPFHLAPRLVSPPELLPTQIRLAQIVEMIHIASNLHNCIEELAPGDDDYGNKISILGGDFLLGRASTALSRLGESKVVELVASVISNLVEGEFLGMEESKIADPSQGHVTLEFAWETYLQESYLKTASLMAKGARSAVILGGCQEGDIWGEVAYAYGRNLGIAHQLQKDSLGVDTMQRGQVTAPALFACDEEPKLLPLMQRRFENEGDIELAKQYIQATDAVQRTRMLAATFGGKAKDNLRLLPNSDTKVALQELVSVVLAVPMVKTSSRKSLLDAVFNL